MFVCAHYEEVAKKMRQIPLAVHVGWFMLGGLLLGFDYWLLTLVGIGLLLPAFAHADAKTFVIKNSNAKSV